MPQHPTNDEIQDEIEDLYAAIDGRGCPTNADIQDEIEFLHVAMNMRRRANGNWNSPWAFRIGPVLQIPLLWMFDKSMHGYPFNTVEGLALGFGAFHQCSPEIRAAWDPWFNVARSMFGEDVLIPRHVRIGLGGLEHKRQMQQFVAITLEYFDDLLAHPDPQRSGLIEQRHTDMMSTMEHRMDEI
jgi:hypothetical protein